MKLTDPFPNVQRRQLKNKRGEVVAEVDFVGWSDVADRLDAAVPGWQFEVMQLQEDWCLGRLTIEGRHFDNVGYAENADADWKKEPLKDAVSDALKRCAAMAGVARYLYAKDAPARPQPVQNGSGRPEPARVAPMPTPVGPGEEAWPDELPQTPAGRMAAFPPLSREKCLLHDHAWLGTAETGYYHKDPAGRWCRAHPDNTPRAAVR